MLAVGVGVTLLAEGAGLLISKLLRPSSPPTPAPEPEPSGDKEPEDAS